MFLPGESQGQGAWWAAVDGVAQSQTRLSDFHFQTIRERESIFIPVSRVYLMTKIIVLSHCQRQQMQLYFFIHPYF